MKLGLMDIGYYVDRGRSRLGGVLKGKALPWREEDRRVRDMLLGYCVFLGYGGIYSSSTFTLRDILDWFGVVDGGDRPGVLELIDATLSGSTEVVLSRLSGGNFRFGSSMLSLLGRFSIEEVRERARVVCRERNVLGMLGSIKDVIDRFEDHFNAYLDWVLGLGYSVYSKSGTFEGIRKAYFTELLIPAVREVGINEWSEVDFWGEMSDFYKLSKRKGDMRNQMWVLQTVGKEKGFLRGERALSDPNGGGNGVNVAIFNAVPSGAKAELDKRRGVVDGSVVERVEECGDNDDE